MTKNFGGRLEGSGEKKFAKYSSWGRIQVQNDSLRDTCKRCSCWGRDVLKRERPLSALLR